MSDVLPKLTPREKCELDGGTWDERSNTCVPSRWRPSGDTKEECLAKGGTWIEGEGCSNIPMPEEEEEDIETEKMEEFTDFLNVKALVGIATSRKLKGIFDISINGVTLDHMLLNPPDDVFPKIASRIYVQLKKVNAIPLFGTMFDIVHALSFRAACVSSMPVNIAGSIIANIIQWMLDKGSFKILGKEVDIIPDFFEKFLTFLQKLVTLDIYEIYLMSLIIFGILMVLLLIVAFKMSPEAIPILGNVAKIVLRGVNKILGGIGMVLK